MVDSTTVLWGQTIVYTLYVLAILAVMTWFSLRLTRSGPPIVPPRLFWSFFGVLVVIGVSLHLVTANTIPWVETEISGGDVTQTYAITMADHEFTLPSPVLEVPCELHHRVTGTDWRAQVHRAAQYRDVALALAVRRLRRRLGTGETAAAGAPAHPRSDA